MSFHGGGGGGGGVVVQRPECREDKRLPGS